MGSILYANDIAAVNQAKIDAARITQASSNARKGAETALNNFNQSLSNKRRLDAAGSQITDNSITASHVQDAHTTNDLNAQLAVARAEGQAAATTAAAGVGGSSVDTYNRTLQLQADMGKQQRDDNYQSQQYEMGQQRGSAVKDAVGGMSNNVYRANLDYTQYVDWHKPSVFEQIAAVGTTVAAAVYGGPAAGQAVASAWESRTAAANNDYATASKSMGTALTSGAQAAKDYAQTHPSKDNSPKIEADQSVFSFNQPQLSYDNSVALM